MKQRTKNARQEQLRSYSRIFSSSSFANLLRKDDFDFITKKFERYDIDNQDKDGTTYFDYLSYVYSLLMKEYRCEYVYKNEIINQLLLKKYRQSQTIMINEFKVGKSIADLVLFNGTSRVFEIKTELDSEKRLDSQLKDYVKIFNECFIVTHESLVDKYINISENIGIIVIENVDNTYSLKKVRESSVSQEIDSDTVMRCVRTSEYKNIVKTYFGKLPDANSFQMFNRCELMMKAIPQKDLNNLFITELKKRQSNTELLPNFFAELRHLCLSLNIGKNQYQTLEQKLNLNIQL